MRTAGVLRDMFQLLTWCPQRDWPRPQVLLNMLGAGLQGMTGARAHPDGPGPGWTRRPAGPALWAASLFSACVSWSPAAGHPAAPHPASIQTWAFRPSRTGAAQAGEPGRSRISLWTGQGCPRVGCPGVRMLHVAKQGLPGLGPPALTPCPLPSPPSLTLGEHRKGVCTGLRTGCVCPVAAAPQGAGTGQGVGEGTEHGCHPAPSS